MSIYSIQVEQAVLAAILTITDCIETYEPKLTEDDFYVSSHKLIFRSILALHATGATVDAVLLADYMTANHSIKLIGGEHTLSRLLTESPTSLFNINGYAAQLKDLTNRRNLDDLANQIKTLASSLDCKDYIEQAQALINQVQGQHATAYRYTLEQACHSAIDITEQRIERSLNSSGLAYGVNTGLSSLDHILGDIEPSYLTVIAAQPGAGKTTLAQMIALNAVKHNNSPTLFVSAEMSAAQVALRMIAAESSIPFSGLKKGRLTEAEWGRFADFTASASQYPLDIIDISSPTVALIRSEANKTIQKYGKVGCIIIDYITLLTDPTQKNRLEEVSKISRDLKAMAKDYACPVIALAQLVKDALGRTPRMGDIRESGQIVQDADHVILLSNDEQESMTNIRVDKNRHGKVGDIKVWQYFDYCRFGDVTDAH